MPIIYATCRMESYSSRCTHVTQIMVSTIVKVVEGAEGNSLTNQLYNSVNPSANWSHGGSEQIPLHLGCLFNDHYQAKHTLKYSKLGISSFFDHYLFYKIIIFSKIIEHFSCQYDLVIYFCSRWKRIQSLLLSIFLE